MADTFHDRRERIFMNKQVIISIGREYGSGGHVIAEIIAKHYNIPLYDRNILDELSKETGNSYDVYKKYDEKPANPFITRTVLGQSNSVEKIIAEMQFNFLKEKAESGESYVVLGRCAEDILQDNDGLISIFLVGDTDVKQKRIMEVKHVSADEALTKMKRHDKSRKQYHNSFSSGKWGDSRYYDVCINTSRLGLKASAEELFAISTPEWLPCNLFHPHNTRICLHIKRALQSARLFFDLLFYLIIHALPSFKGVALGALPPFGTSTI